MKTGYHPTVATKLSNVPDWGRTDLQTQPSLPLKCGPGHRTPLPAGTVAHWAFQHGPCSPNPERSVWNKPGGRPGLTDIALHKE